ncbi:MAG: T9SS type A sorting domain-containing protein [candidate division WOR-3 bacterium]|nr:T9SS type A sorting domain-containing protein [candidate division WOR-3 bacterium]
MRKLLLVLLISVPLFAATGWLINGDSVATDTVGSLMFVEGHLEGGDTTGLITMYIDLDNDGLIDPEDPAMFYAIVIDGSWEDIDESKNGYFSAEEMMFPVSGDYIITVEDNISSDQVILHNKPLTSSYSIYGNISKPDTSGLAVLAGPMEVEDMIGDITDIDGNFVIHISDTYVGSYLNFGLMNVRDTLSEYLGPVRDSIHLSGNVLHNDSMTPTDYSMIQGWFVDETDLPYTKPIVAQAVGYYVDIFGNPCLCLQHGSVTTGVGKMFLHTSPLGKEGNRWNVDLDLDSDPYSMSPPDIEGISFGSTPDTLTDTITIYSCDAAIAGTVFIDDNPADTIEVWAWNDTTGGAPYTRTYSDGHYRILVSSYANSYWVGIETEDSVAEGDQLVAPGSTGVNFHIITSGIEEKPVSQELKISPNPFINSVVLEVSGITGAKALRIYDVTGKLVDIVYPENSGSRIVRYQWDGSDRDGKALPAGVYFGRIEGEKPITGKLILIR